MNLYLLQLVAAEINDEYKYNTTHLVCNVYQQPRLQCRHSRL